MAETTTHSPGPWRWFVQQEPVVGTGEPSTLRWEHGDRVIEINDPEEPGVIEIEDATGAPLAQMLFDIMTMDEAGRDARLIAAAPDLLKVCDYITSLSAGWDEDGSLGPRAPLSWETVARMAMDVARHASAQARGE